jgi:ABC-type transport system involved in cytochrome c biogenesis permease subunit
LFGFIGLLVRWYESYLIGLDIGHIPISNLYEVFILFCLITSLLYLFYEERFNTKKLGAFVLIVINAAVGFILWYTFDRHADGVQPLVPALQSYWMKIHVPANFIGYGSFSLAAMVSVAYLFSGKKILTSYLPKLAVLDDLIYKSFLQSQRY